MKPDDEDERLGLLLRAIRRRAGMTQLTLAAAARVPRGDVMAVEAGRAHEVELGRLRRIFATADARLKVVAWWRGAVADRLLDERHAALLETALALYERRGWQATTEVTFSEWGERGSIDLLAGHRATRLAVVNEVKATIGSLEETNRVLSVKARLARRLVNERFGWGPAAVSRLLIVPTENTVRRVVERHGHTMRALYPMRGREVRAWLRDPSGPGHVGGIWFVSEVRNSDTIHG